MRNRVLVAVLAVLVLPALAQAIEFSAGFRFNNLDPSGSFSSGTPVVGLPSSVKLGSDVGIDDDDPLSVVIRLDANKHHLWVSHEGIKFEGNKNLTRTFTFESRTYTVGTRVNSELTFDLTQIQYHYDLFSTSDGERFGLTLSPLFKINIYDTSIELDAPTLGINESFSEQLPLPTVGLLATLDIGPHSKVSVQADGIGYDGSTFTEYEVTASCRPLEYLQVDVGHKSVEIDFSDSGDKLDFEMGGLFAQIFFVWGI